MRGLVGSPRPDGELALLGAHDDISLDAGVLQGDGLGVPFQRRPEELVDGTSADGRRNDGGRDAGLQLPGLAHHIAPEGMDAGPVPCAEADDCFDDRSHQARVLALVAGGCLQFTEDCHLAIDQLEHFIEGGDVFALAGIGLGELIDGEPPDASFEVCGAVDGLVVHEDGDPIGAQLQVDFDGLGAGIEADFHSRQCVGRGFTRSCGVADDERLSHGSKAYRNRVCVPKISREAGRHAPILILWHDWGMDESLAGKLLVASPRLTDPNFARTVVLICTHDENGAFGLVLNRPLHEARVSEHLPAWAGHVAEPPVVFQGGPVETTVGLGLGCFSEPRAEAPGWTPVQGNVGLVDLSKLPGTDGAPELERARVFAGYSGWAGGQLEGELNEDGWFVVPLWEGDAFTQTPESLWREVLRRQGGKLAFFAFLPEDPSQN